MPTAAEKKHFTATAPIYMRMLMQDFPSLGVEDAAAVFGNFGHESKGLTDDQEDNPTVSGSRGGLNWAQWTGPRRRAMEAYCKRNSLDPNSDIAAYKWLWNELRGSEKRAIQALVNADGLENKTVAFERAFLRAGVKHDDSRLVWAKLALAAYNTAYPEGAPEPVEDEPDAEGAADDDAEVIEVLVPEILPKPVSSGRPGWLALVIIGLLAAGVAYVVNRWGVVVSEDISTDRAMSLFGEPGKFRDVWGDIALQVGMAFVLPLVAAAATTAVGWVTYWWGRLFKVDFEAKSATMLHEAFERAMLTAIERFGPKAKQATLVSSAADYMEVFNPDTAKKLGRERLEALAVPHIATAKATATAVTKNLR